MRSSRRFGTQAAAAAMLAASAAIGAHFYRAGAAAGSAEMAESGGCRGQHGVSCRWCEAAIRWREENPDRRDADIVDAAEQGLNVTLYREGEED